jgi:hypothetical protein
MLGPLGSENQHALEWHRWPLSSKIFKVLDGKDQKSAEVH